MKQRYDFGKGKRGRVAAPEPEPEGNAQITIRLDKDIVDRLFQRKLQELGYQTLVNAAVRENLDDQARRFDAPS